MKSCLIVDQSRVQRSFTRAIVENLTFSCREAADGKTALSACAFAMPDAVLLDWHLPGVSGVECLKAIRGLPRGDHPKIILCSTDNEIEQIMLALEEGADEYIMKPFDQDIVRSKFEQTGLV